MGKSKRSFTEELELAMGSEETPEQETPVEEQPPQEEVKPEETTPVEETQTVEEEPKVEETKPEVPLPTEKLRLDKHPRFIRQQKRLEELEAWKEQQEARLREVAPVSSPQQTIIPREFEQLFGENVDLYQAWQKMVDDQVTTKAQAIIEARERETNLRAEQERRAQEQAVTFAEDQFLELAEETGVNFTDRSNSVRNEVLDICDKYGIFDENGLPDLRKSYDLYMRLNPAKTDVIEEKRKIAAKTNVKANSGTEATEIITSAKLREIEKRGGVYQFFK